MSTTPQQPNKSDAADGDPFRLGRRYLRYKKDERQLKEVIAAKLRANGIVAEINACLRQVEAEISRLPPSANGTG